VFRAPQVRRLTRVAAVDLDDPRRQYSAKFDSPFYGPITEAPVTRVRDVVLCATDPSSVDFTTEEIQQHPPIASPRLLRSGGSADSVDLGRGVRIDRLSNDDAKLVMDACSPRGHFFAPIRRLGQRYSFVREVDLAMHDEQPFRWDDEGTLWDALSLSRLIRDNANSTEYAARVAEHEDGMQSVAYTLRAESKHVYRLRRDREWLDPAEGAQLRDLLREYWAAERTLPRRVQRAMWRTEYASWLKWADLVLPVLVGGLEALLKTERLRSTRQFVTRVPALAEEVGVKGIDHHLCGRIYDARSEWVHGAHVRLFATGQEAQEAEDVGAAEGPQTDEQWSIFSEIARVQDVLRATARRCIEDDGFRAIFTGDDLIRSRWPV
jgi:hypothetical protein